MLCRELSSWDWNGFVVLRCLGFFLLARSLSILETSKFWTISDWTEFGLVRPSLNSFDVSCHEFCTVFIFAAWHVYGFHTRGNHCDLFCSHVKGCACIDSWLWVSFCMLPSVCTISFLSETSKSKWPHNTCQDVRHASWGNSECDLYRKCESSIKVWGTRLRMNERERDGFLLSVIGWVVA